ncbi:HET domain protein [Fonsecaea pedrosoi]|nr:HET domain protein [Fonsecaea pedrosoi]
MSQDDLCTVSRDRVRSIYLDGLKWKSGNQKGIPPTFLPRDTSYHSDKDLLISFTSEQANRRARDWCQAYYYAAQDPEHHIHLLDRAVGALLRCNFEGVLSEDAIITQTCALLSRLPRTPQLPASISAQFNGAALPWLYFRASHSGCVRLDRDSWHELLVTNWVDTSSIRLALTIVQIRDEMIDTTQTFVDTLAELTATAFDLSAKTKDTADHKHWLVAKSFLWTCWCRSLMLHFHYHLGMQLRAGYDAERNESLNMRQPLPGQDGETPNSLEALPQYMCRWAFALLRLDRASIGQDFRDFRRRFGAMFNDNPARCILSSSQACNGQGPEHCQRFTGMTIVDQSAHDFRCNGGCDKMFWDEFSYRNIEGARAVSVKDSDNVAIRYCQASSRTLSVSHVWAHGAGGRPHTGMNACLHARLIQLAHENKCDSYWMDTPCIPENHDLRAEAIANINKIFTISRMTLIWDRDIMSIDISDGSIETWETLLSTLLVCDWNVRSWTLLESMRARHTVHLLCKYNRIISVKECLTKVHEQGSMAIANLFLTHQQILPAQPPSPFDKNPRGDIARRRDGYISVEESICLLAYRHASRPGDSTVIMSLLHDTTPAYTAEMFWKSKINSIIHTGVLFSSLPRLQCKGFGWAPAQPEVSRLATTTTTSSNATSLLSSPLHLVYDGAGTSVALITDKGLDATFTTFEVSGPSPSRFPASVKAFKDTFARGDRRGVDCPSRRAREEFKLHKYRHARFVLAAKVVASSGYYVYRGPRHGTVFGVVGSNDKAHRIWHWLGVFEWDAAAPWPPMRREVEDIFLV